MKLKYYVSKIRQPKGDHEVHDHNCKNLPNVGNRIYLGEFESCRAAVHAAKNFYVVTNGCKFCSPECNTR